MNFIYDYLNIESLKSCIDFRETCHHFIDYEIYDSLDDELKIRYVDQFSLPKLSFVMEKEFYIPKMMCKANHLDPIHKNMCDCSDKYKKTLKQLEKYFDKK